MKVSTQAQDIITRFKSDSLEIIEGYTFNQYENIKRINLYLNQRFIECSNQDAIFWDLSSSRIAHTAKNIDLDTKDLVPFGVGETNMLQAWILRVKFRKWMEDNGTATMLDDLVDGVASFGSAVWKVVPIPGKKAPELEEVDLRNLYFEQTAKTLKEVPVVEIHHMTPLEVKRKSNVWENTSEILKDEPGEGNLYEIWEFTGETDEDEPRYVHEIGFNFGDNEVILFTEEIKEDKNPYRDFHIGKYRGRWQRIGIVERLYKLQERANTVVNQNAQATEIASLLLLRSNDSGTGNNVLEQAVNGQIIKSADLEQIGIDNRAFNVLLGELQTIEAQADRVSLTPDIVQGEALPSGTPFRSLATLANAAKSAFKSTRDRIGNGLSEILREDIMPKLVAGWQRKELIDIAGYAEDIKEYDDRTKDRRELEALATANRTGKVITPEEISEAGVNALSDVEEKGRPFTIPKGFFNFEYGIKFNISGESFDKQQQNDAMFNAIQMVVANPAVSQIPLFKQFLENNGIEWWRMTPRQLQELAQTAQGQGALPEPKTGDKLLSQVDSN